MQKKPKNLKIVKLNKHKVDNLGDTGSLTASQYLRYVAKNIRGTDIEHSKIAILICLSEGDEETLPELELFSHKMSPIETSGYLLEAIKQF